MKIVVFCTLWNEEIFQYYYDGFRNWAKEHDAVVDVIACYGRTNLTDKFNVGEYNIYSLPELKDYDGAVLVTSLINQKQIRESLFGAIKEAGIPCVTIDYETEGFSSIGIDQQCDFTQLVHHMVEVHHAKRICYIGGTPENVESAFRMEGFLQGMKECGLTPEPELVREMKFDYLDGRQFVSELLADGITMPDAFICANDDMAIGVCDELQENGYYPGRDVRVSGYDNYFTGENYSPRLTSVRRPREELAYRACDMIRRQMEGGGVEHIVESSDMVFGETCGCDEDACLNHQRFRQTIFRRLFQRDILDSALFHMEEKIIAGESIENVICPIASLLNKYRHGHCRIMLHAKLESEGNVSFDSYRDCTINMLSRQGEEAQDGDMGCSGYAYIYAPIHFMERCYGVCIFRDMDTLLYNKGLLNFTKSIGFSIENVIQKRKYFNMNRQLNYLYETDNLTGVYNRHGLERHAERFYNDCMNRGEKVQVIFADIDHLKTINDSLGHESGDVAIRMVAQALAKFRCEGCLVFRYGGDEFLVLRSDTLNYEEFERGVHAYLEEQQREHSLPFFVSTSVGCIIADPLEGRCLEQCIQAADMQMYELKKRRHQQDAQVTG